MVIPIELAEENPWWSDPVKVDKDPQISKWNNSVIKWNPRIGYTFEFDKDLVYSLRGPRQVGKTTMLKLIIRNFLKEGMSPWNIMYYACDIESTPRDLVALVKGYLDNTKMQRDKERCYLFLDEISSIKDWQKGIKKLWDQGRLENCTVIVTGSHIRDIKRSTERLPGRRGSTGDALDKIMLAMKFSEFVSVMDPDLDYTIRKNSLTTSDKRTYLERLLKDGTIDAPLRSIQTHMKELNRHLEDYMLTGGIPKVVEQYARSKTVNEGSYADHLNAILGDLGTLNGDKYTFGQLAENIIKSVGATSSWNSLRKNTDIGADGTVSRYVGILDDMFTILVLYQYNSEKRRALYRKEKKIHFQDPFYFHVLNSWVSSKKSFDTSHRFVTSVENQGRLVEGIVANHLVRLAFLRSQKKPLFDYHNHICYWKYGKDREVDLIYNDGDQIEIPIEVKFQKKPTKRDLDGVINFKKQAGVTEALLLTKDTLSVERECIMIPASMFLLLI